MLETLNGLGIFIVHSKNENKHVTSMHILPMALCFLFLSK
jgi:hypothetical protein